MLKQPKLALNCIFALSFIAIGIAQAMAHPLDDLTEAEIKRAVSIIKDSGKFTQEIRFPILSVNEPKKAAFLSSPEGEGLHREVKAVVFEKLKNELYEVTVDLNDGKILSSKKVSGVQPPILLEEYTRMANTVKADPRWQAAMKKRGFANLDDLAVDGWAPGLLSKEERASKARLMRGLTYFKGKRENYYARPVEGVIATVDMNTDKVVSLTDLEVVPVPPSAYELDEESIRQTSGGTLRPASVSPIQISQPDGPGFKVTGQKIEWNHWSFRFNFQPMKGLTLYQIAYKDSGKPRSILYKGGLSEMTVPYGDPAKTWSFRNAFDVGEYGLGRTAHPLTPLVDVPSNAVFFNSWYADDFGVPQKIDRAVAIYEKDGGLLWKHLDQTSCGAIARRTTYLVVTFMTTVGNYDYAIDSIFHQDGAVDVQARLTGILLAKGSELKRNPCRGAKSCHHLAEPEIVTPPHQHFFCFRLDFDVDGASGNVPVEMDTYALPINSKNPDGNAFDMKNTPLLSERRAARDLSPANARKWKVLNTEVTNALGHPVGYALFPGETAKPYLTASSPIRRRAGYLDHTVWFTQYRDEEQSAAGEYPNQSAGRDGLKEWVKRDASLDGKDIVMWYVFGVTHVPHPEEWPVMNVHQAGFKLVPVNFFSRNPALDLQAVPKEKVEKAVRDAKVLN